MGDGLIVASNRGPVRWQPGEGGELRARRGFGGLVTALGGALQHESGTWISVALSADDAAVAAEHGGAPFDVSVDGSRYRLRLLDAGERFDAYYNEVSNKLLWFTLHGLWNEPYEPSGLGWSTAWEEGYLPVNDAVAAAVVEEAAGGGEVFLQDYHLCTAGSRVREALGDVPILHYLHTPWVGPGELRRLPDRVTSGVLRGLLAADVVALSSPMWCRAFRRCAEDFLDARIEGDTVVYRGHRTLVQDFVLGVDPDDLARSAASERALRAGEALDARAGGRRIVLRVDRTDLSKNILRGLRAFELLLERHPEHRGSVWHYANLNPSRQGVPEYREYLDACREAAERIARRFGEEAVALEVADDYPGVIAALQRYDVLLTNPVIDGTNLVAKEGPLLNDRDGVLVLSRAAGAATVLGDGPLYINPYDVEETAEALHDALRMDAHERARRARVLRSAARRGAPADWFEVQRAMLRAAVARRRM
jgi:trehalose 6-phosphate synthase